jgi:hypothetical protein
MAIFPTRWSTEPLAASEIYKKWYGLYKTNLDLCCYREKTGFVVFDIGTIGLENKRFETHDEYAYTSGRYRFLSRERILH